MKNELTEEEAPDTILLELKLIKEYLKKRTKKDIHCHLCNNDLPLKTIHDFMKNYSAAIYCIVLHCKEFEDGHLLIEKLYNVERYALKLIQFKEETIGSLLKDSVDKEFIARRDQLVAAFKSFSVDTNIHIYCEEDIDSITYKFYKRFPENQKRMVQVDFLLFILYLRKESNRFFKVFDGILTKSEVSYRLALLFTLRTDCEVSTDSVLKRMSYQVELIPTNVSDTNFMEEIDKYVQLSADVDPWLDRAYQDYHWNECIRLWKINMSNTMVSVNMIDVCVKYRHYEDGWLIYGWLIDKESATLKASLLCVEGYRITHEPVWVTRLAQIYEQVIKNKKQPLCCTLTRDILDRISTHSDADKRIILKRVISKAGDIVDDQIAKCMLRGIYNLSRNKSDNETLELLFEFAQNIYKWWKDNCLSFFFTPSSSGDIYSTMLGVCGATKHINKFIDVCKDIKASKTKINSEILETLENFHSEMNCKCGLFDSFLKNDEFAKQLLKHVVQELNSKD
ncbi:hypothetical protein DMUE_4053 [Dictyocoela muelleri]|nr:hypothetical protein DMUE_4053 [Dictyocoela muelleri]